MHDVASLCPVLQPERLSISPLLPVVTPAGGRQNRAYGALVTTPCRPIPPGSRRSTVIKRPSRPRRGRCAKLNGWPRKLFCRSAVARVSKHGPGDVRGRRDGSLNQHSLSRSRKRLSACTTNCHRMASRPATFNGSYYAQRRSRLC